MKFASVNKTHGPEGSNWRGKKAQECVVTTKMYYLKQTPERGPF